MLDSDEDPRYNNDHFVFQYITKKTVLKNETKPDDAYLILFNFYIFKNKNIKFK